MDLIKEIPKKCFLGVVRMVVAGLVALGKIMEHFEVKD